MTKKITAIALALIMCIGCITPALAAAKDFTDVPDGAWYSEAVDYAVENGLFSGTTATTFDPNGTMTRGMFVTVLGRLAGVNIEDISDNERFTDVDFDAYYGPYISWASNNRFINGVTATEFNPSAPITRQDIAVIVDRFANYSGAKLPEVMEPMSFKDGSLISSYAESAVRTLQLSGLMVGDSNNNFKPLNNISRAEAVTLMMRLDELINGFDEPFGLNLSATTLTIAVGDTAQLTAYVLPDGRDDTVTWSSANNKVAAVDNNGLVVANTAGTATITARIGNLTAICNVSVIKPAPDDTTSGSTGGNTGSTGNTGSGTTTEPSTNPGTGSETTPGTSPSPETPKTVPVANVTLSQYTAELKVGGTITLAAYIDPADATNRDVVWTTSDKDVATVKDGVVTAGKVAGSCVIYASVDGKTAGCTVTVTEEAPKVIPVSGIKLDKTTAEMHVGDAINLVVTVSPEDASDKSVTWTASNDKATVKDGTVVANELGKVTITAKAGSFSAKCDITIVPVEVTEVVIDQPSAKMVIGDTIKLTATVIPDNATDKKITWESDHPEIASVKDGVVTAKTNGQAQISAMAGGKTGVCNITVSEKQVAVTGVSLDMTELTMAKDSTAELVASVQPENASDKTVVWQSSDEGTVSVDGSKLTAKKAGSAKITATAGGFMATCEVTVVDNGAASFTVSGGPSASLLVYSANLTSMFGAGGQVCVWGNSDGSYQHATDAITGEDAGLIFGNRGNISLTSGQVREGMWGKPVNVSDISSDSVPLDYNRSKPYTMKIVGAQDVIKIVEDESREYGNIEVVAFLKPGDTPKSTTIVVTSPWDGTSVTIPVTVRYLPVYNVNSAEYRDAYGRELLRLCNEARKEVGAPAMTYASEVQDVADLRATEALPNMSHTRPNGERFHTAFTELGHPEYTMYMVGENLGVQNGAVAMSPEECAKHLFNGWMSSEGHKANILNSKYTQMVASVASNDGTSVVSAQLFIIK